MFFRDKNYFMLKPDDITGFDGIEINMIIDGQLYGYFKQLVTDFIQGKDTIDEK